MGKIGKEEWWSRRELNPGVKFESYEILHVYLIKVSYYA